MFKELKGYPATIRFLDPPLHEFLPHEEAAQNDLAKKMGVPVEKISSELKNYMNLTRCSASEVAA